MKSGESAINIKVYTLNAFAKTDNGGNPAGVVLNADALSENDMKRISNLVGFSETAFVTKSSLADFKVRFFTPNEEVDICGHATVATFHTLEVKDKISTGTYFQETKAGILRVAVKDDYTIMMTQNTPQFYEVIDKQEIANSLNISINKIIEDLPVQIVSTGLKDIIIPIKNIDTLNHINPNFSMISDISRKYNTIGYHLFTLETLYGSNAHCRNFAPLYDIPEESATGTSNGALACYLFKYNKITSQQSDKLVIEQGYSMDKPSEIYVSLLTNNSTIIEVNVGGKALNMSEMNVEI